jgi:3-oxoadipate enol-lactonase
VSYSAATSKRMLRNGHAQTHFGRLAYADQGNGPAIVLWPSIMMDADMFAAQVTALSESHRVIAIDPPGHGESATLDRQFSLAECAEAVIEILESCNEKTAIIAGNSWGGMVAIQMAARHRDRTRAIIVMNSTATPASKAHHLLYGGMPVMVRIFGIISPLIAIATRSFLGATAYQQRRDLRTLITEKLRSLDRVSTVHVVNSILLGREDQRQYLSQIRCPTLIIGGTEDRIFKPAEQQHMHQRITHSQLVMVPAGHFAPLEATDEVTSNIAAFAEKLART